MEVLEAAGKSAAESDPVAALTRGARVFERAHHVRRSCDFSSRTNSAAHSRASRIFPASRKARAFARAWLSADRSAGDSLPALAPDEARAAGGVLRIPASPTRFQRVINLDRQRFDRNAYLCRQPYDPPLTPSLLVPPHMMGMALQTPLNTGGTVTDKGGILPDPVPGVRLIQAPRGEYARAFL